MSKQKMNIDSIYPLSPVQQGMLFHTLLAPKSSVYFNQMLYTLTGRLQKMAMQRAWQQVVDRHESLRTLFVWEAREKPLQVVRRRVTLPWEELDWRGLSSDEQNAKLTAFLHADRQRGFDLTQAPLTRLALIRLGENHHELIWSHHHLLIDGWSSFLILKDVMAIYQAISEGRDCQLEPVRPYRDYINWLHGQDRSKAEGFWRAALKGFAAPTPLLASPRAEGREVPDYEIAEQLGSTPPSLTAALKSFARQNDLTLSTIVQGAWAILLSRYSGETDIVFGSTVSGRSAELVGIESMVGLFINSLPVRAQFSPQVVTLAWLKDFQDKLVEVRQYEHSPLVDVQGWSEVRRGHPLFQSLVVFENYPVDTSVWGQDGILQISNMRVVGPTNYPLAIVVVPRKELSIRVSYDSRRFDVAAISRMLGHFNTLLEGIVANPGRRLAELPMLTEAERQQVLYEWNDTKADYPKELCVHQLFQQQVERDPDAVAVVYEDQSLSYGELNARSNRLAHHLKGLGVGPDVLVAICMERSLEMVVGLLGILKAGGAYVPLDPSYPADRLAFMIKDSAPAVILSHGPARAALQAALAGLASRPPILELEADLPLWTGQPVADPDPAAVGLTSSHLAYVIYTSGSTGTPKGVAVTHEGLHNYVTWAVRYYRLNLGSGAPVLTPFAFDATVTSLYLPILVGKLILLLPEEQQVEILARRDPDLGKFSLLKLTPAHLDALNHSAPFAYLKELTHCLVIGGESLSETTVAPWRQHAPQIRLINEYGPTETVVGCVVYEVRPSDPDEGSVPIGRPISNTRIYLLDEGLQPVPVGVAGEIYIGGAGVARGYLNRPELTAERFITSPFVAGDRLYKTGDLGRYLADGNIEFLGRNDFQVKIRGYRIELGEIEARLLSYPGVREAVVLAREDATGDKRLVAYYSSAQDAAPRIDELREFLKQQLPEYMVPAAFVLLEKLPLTANGKLDRKALPEPDGESYATQAYEAPAGPVESVVAEIWAGLLGRERVGRHDNFFDLGGHSLLALRMLVRMRSAGLQAEVRALFATPSLSAFAAEVGARSSVVEVPPNLIPPGCEAITPDMLPLCRLRPAEIEGIVGTVPGGSANIQDIYPLGPLQEGILFHHLLAREGDPYLSRKLFGFVDRAKLEVFVAALNAVIRRHDILRTSVVWEGVSEPVQVVWRHAPLGLEEIDLDPSNGDIAEQLRQRFDPRHYRLDVRQAPMLRLIAAREPATGRWLGIELRHHLITDHTTVEIMDREVRAYLEGAADALPAPLPFRDFVGQTRLGASQDAHRAFFRAMLGDVEEPSAPFGVMDVYGDGSGVTEVRVSLDRALSRRLRSRGRALRVSPASLFHVAWGQVVARTCGREDAVFGTVLFGHMQGGDGTDRALGPFLNTLPARLRLDETGAERCVRQTHDLLAELMMHEHAPLTLAQRCSAVAAPLPLFTSLLNYRHSVAGAAAQPWTGIEYLGASERTNYPLTLAVDDLGEGFTLTVQAAGRIDAPRVSAMMQQALESLVRALEQTPDRPVSQLDILAPEERHRLLVEWNATAADYPKELCVHQLFEQQAVRNPEAVAVVYEDWSLSYGELNARSNRLAHHLRGLGVGPDVLVAICVEQSLEMVVGLLAILKAGGAYVPLDPSYPADRLAFMIKDSAPAVILTQTSLRERFSGRQMHVVCLDDGPAELERQSTDNPRCAVTADDLAYVIYTSGSTGVPKGVQIPHRSVVNLLTSMERHPGITQSDTLLAVTTLSFDIAGLELFLPLTTGARVVIVAREVAIDGKRLMAIMERLRATIMQATPAIWRLMLESGWGGRPTLKILCGGESWSAELADELLPRCESLWNMYGPTETTIWSSVSRVERGNPILIGPPIANTTFHILDSGGQPVPVGVAGEIYIGGAGVGRGYLNRPELTAERFITSPFVAGDRLYKTGDLGRYLADGNIEFLGRNDFQVKIRGYRIELGEIETRLSSCPGVREAAVLAREDAGSDRRLVTYYTAAAGGEPDVEALRAHLAAALPAYMVPAAYVRLDTMPLTPNGKLDRQALPAPEPGRANPAGSFVDARTPIEEALAEIWGRVLGLTQLLGVHDNFFDLGGHSLLAVRLLVEVKKSLDFDVSVPMFFEDPTIAGMARAIQEGWEIKGEPQLIPLKPGDSAETVFLLQAGVGLCRLARSLNAGTAVFATHDRSPLELFQDPTGKRLADFGSVESLAAPHAALIRSHLRSGRCLLVGYSFGGVLAFEVAHQLQREGISVGMILLLDTGTKGLCWWEKLRVLLTEGRESLTLDRARQSLHRRARQSWRRIQTAIAPRAAAMADNQLSLELEQTGLLLGHVPERIVALYRNSATNYRYRPLDCRAVYFQCHNVYAPYATRVWESFFSRGMEIIEVPGDHLSLLKEPYVRVLAKKIDDLLEQLRAEHASALEPNFGDGRCERAA
jgi:amino acid adenylation domain-containing protein